MGDARRLDHLDLLEIDARPHAVVEEARAFAQQYLAAGLIDEMLINVVPVLLGSGTRLFENLGDVSAIGLEQVKVVEAPGVAHLLYRRA